MGHGLGWPQRRAVIEDDLCRLGGWGEVGGWLACRTWQGQLGRTSLRARTTGSLGPGALAWEKRATNKQTPSLSSLFARRTQAEGMLRYWVWTHIAEFSNLLMLDFSLDRRKEHWQRVSSAPTRSSTLASSPLWQPWALTLSTKCREPCHILMKASKKWFWT